MSSVNLNKTSHVIYFAGILPALSLGLTWTFFKLVPNPPFWLETISPVYAYLLLYALFERYCWSWKIFRVVNISCYPNLNGRWEGKLRSSHKENDNNIVVPAVLEIRQTFSKIFVRALFERSESESSITNFSDRNGDTYLYYTYDSEPNSLKTGTMQNHKGTAKLMYIGSDHSLKGMYFNSIGNNGEMEFTFSTKVLKGHY